MGWRVEREGLRMLPQHGPSAITVAAVGTRKYSGTLVALVERLFLCKPPRGTRYRLQWIVRRSSGGPSALQDVPCRCFLHVLNQGFDVRRSFRGDEDQQQR